MIYNIKYVDIQFGSVHRLGTKGKPSQRSSMPGIEGRCEGLPLAPKRRTLPNCISMYITLYIIIGVQVYDR